MGRFYTEYTNRRRKTYGAQILAGDGVHTRGWNAGVQVTARERGQDGSQDNFDVSMTGGSHNADRTVLLGTVVHTPDGPQWAPATADGTSPVPIWDPAETATPAPRPRRRATPRASQPAAPAEPTREDHELARNALQLAIDTLLGHDCTTGTCPGPDITLTDLTCRVCASVQDLRAELSRLGLKITTHPTESDDM